MYCFKFQDPSKNQVFTVWYSLCVWGIGFQRSTLRQGGCISSVPFLGSIGLVQASGMGISEIHDLDDLCWSYTPRTLNEWWLRWWFIQPFGFSICGFAMNDVSIDDIIAFTGIFQLIGWQCFSNFSDGGRWWSMTWTNKNSKQKPLHALVREILIQQMKDVETTWKKSTILGIPYWKFPQKLLVSRQYHPHESKHWINQTLLILWLNHQPEGSDWTANGLRIIFTTLSPTCI